MPTTTRSSPIVNRSLHNVNQTLHRGDLPMKIDLDQLLHCASLVHGQGGLRSRHRRVAGYVAKYFSRWITTPVAQAALRACVRADGGGDLVRPVLSLLQGAGGWNDLRRRGGAEGAGTPGGPRHPGLPASQAEVRCTDGRAAIHTKSVLEKTGRLNNQSSAGVAYLDRVMLGMLVFKSS